MRGGLCVFGESIDCFRHVGQYQHLGSQALTLNLQRMGLNFLLRRSNGFRCLHKKLGDEAAALNRHRPSTRRFVWVALVRGEPLGPEAVEKTPIYRFTLLTARNISSSLASLSPERIVQYNRTAGVRIWSI
jgi:hypothetical protein